VTTNFAFLIIWTALSFTAAFLIGRRLGRVSPIQKRLSDKELLKLYDEAQRFSRIIERDNNRLQRDNARLEQELRKIER
jgi:hypothetical protein